MIVTDKLASYQVAHRELVPSVAHRRSRYLNIHTEFAGARPSPLDSDRSSGCADFLPVECGVAGYRTWVVRPVENPVTERQLWRSDP